MTKIGVISDSHGNTEAVRQAIRILDSLQVDRIIHCGDVGPEIIALLDGYHVDLVQGNMDDAGELKSAIVEPKHTLHDDIGSLEVEGLRVAFLHGHDERLLHHTVHSGHWDLVCHGHTHAFSNSSNGKTRVLNPGALSRTSHPSLAIVTLPSLDVAEIRL